MKTIKRTIACTILLLLAAACPAAAEEITLSVNAGWNLVSFGFNSSGIYDVLTDEGTEILGYDAATDTYEKITSNAGIKRGEAYWLKTEYGKTFTFDGTAYSTGTFSVQMNSGWNLLGNPFQATLPLENITVSGTPISQPPEILSNQLPLYFGADSYYQANGALKANEGFWQYSNESTQIDFEGESQSVIADAGEDHKCIISVYYVVTDCSTECVFTEHQSECSLDGRGSVGSTGNISYNWEQVYGPSIEIINTTASQASFVPTSAAQYGFKLTVEDSATQETDTVYVNAIRIPGKIVLYSALTTSLSQLYVMNADGTDWGMIPSLAEKNSSPRWSPDGSRIVFTSVRSDGDNQDIYIIDEDGSNEQNITNTAEDDAASDWTVDNKILFWSYSTPTDDLLKMDPDGSNIVEITNTGIDDYGKASLDGSMIAVTGNYGGDNWEVSVVNSDGSNFARLTNDTMVQACTGWTTDNKILFSQRVDILSPQKLYVMNTDGTGKQEWPLPDGVEEIGNSFQMTPDGQFTIYQKALDQSYEASIHAMCSDGTCDARIGIPGFLGDYHPGP